LFAPIEFGLGKTALIGLPFGDAGMAWLESRKPYISERTVEDYRNYIKTLSVFFGNRRLTEIDADDIREYQRKRMETAGASAINHECSALQQMLKRVGRWKEIADDYQPLPLPKESPHRALTPLEESRLYTVGAQNPQWDVAFCAFVISSNTTAGPGEIRHIRLMDVDREQRTFRVQPEGAKVLSRIRVIPLNDPAWKAMKYLLERAQKLGSSEPFHYLLPFRIKKNTYDPARPMKGWRYAHRELCATIGLKVSPYSFRHHAITKLLENPDVSEKTVEAIAGHVSQRMKDRYAHIRIEARRAAVAALSDFCKPGTATQRRTTKP
jgi:integrase